VGEEVGRTAKNRPQNSPRRKTIVEKKIGIIRKKKKQKFIRIPPNEGSQKRT